MYPMMAEYGRVFLYFPVYCKEEECKFLLIPPVNICAKVRRKFLCCRPKTVNIFPLTFSELKELNVLQEHSR